MKENAINKVDKSQPRKSLTQIFNPSPNYNGRSICEFCQ